jgi:hypothetical protein
MAVAKLPFPDEQPHTVSALRDKRSAIAGAIAMHNAQITRLRGELIHIDAVLRYSTQIPILPMFLPIGAGRARPNGLREVR